MIHVMYMQYTITTVLASEKKEAMNGIRWRINKWWDPEGYLSWSTLVAWSPLQCYHTAGWATEQKNIQPGRNLLTSIPKGPLFGDPEQAGVILNKTEWMSLAEMRHQKGHLACKNAASEIPKGIPRETLDKNVLSQSDHGNWCHVSFCRR